MNPNSLQGTIFYDCSILMGNSSACVYYMVFTPTNMLLLLLFVLYGVHTYQYVVVVVVCTIWCSHLPICCCCCCFQNIVAKHVFATLF